MTNPYETAINCRKSMNLISDLCESDLARAMETDAVRALFTVSYNLLKTYYGMSDSELRSTTFGDLYLRLSCIQPEGKGYQA